MENNNTKPTALGVKEKAEKPVDIGKLADQLKEYLNAPKPSTTVLVTPEQLNEISKVLGAGFVRNGQELIDLIKARTSIFLPQLNASIQLAPEDLTALKEQFLGTGYTDFDVYVQHTIINAIAMYLFGSIRVFEVA